MSRYGATPTTGIRLSRTLWIRITLPKDHRNGRWHIYMCARGIQGARYRINFKNYDGARGLVCCQQKFPTGVDAETSWCFSLSGFVFNIVQSAAFFIHLIYHDAVMPTIGSIQKMPCRMNKQFSRTISTFKSFRQSGK